MSHPFELSPAELEAMDLDFEEQLTDDEIAHMSGGRHSHPPIVCISAPCPGSEGGDAPDNPYPKPPFSYPKPPFSYPKPPFSYPKPPVATTLAIGEEGGGGGPIRTKALHETGGYSDWSML